VCSSDLGPVDAQHHAARPRPGRRDRGAGVDPRPRADGGRGGRRPRRPDRRL